MDDPSKLSTSGSLLSVALISKVTMYLSCADWLDVPLVGSVIKACAEILLGSPDCSELTKTNFLGDLSLFTISMARNSQTPPSPKLAPTGVYVETELTVVFIAKYPSDGAPVTKIDTSSRLTSDGKLVGNVSPKGIADLVCTVIEEKLVTPGDVDGARSRLGEPIGWYKETSKVWLTFAALADPSCELATTLRVILLFNRWSLFEVTCRLGNLSISPDETLK